MKRNPPKDGLRSLKPEHPQALRNPAKSTTFYAGLKWIGGEFGKPGIRRGKLQTCLLVSDRGGGLLLRSSQTRRGIARERSRGGVHRAVEEFEVGGRGQAKAETGRLLLPQRRLQGVRRWNLLLFKPQILEFQRPAVSP